MAKATPARDDTHCRACGSESLWSCFVGSDGLAIVGDGEDGARWATFCGDCGHDQDHKPRRRG